MYIIIRQPYIVFAIPHTHTQSPLGCMYNMVAKEMCVGDHKVSNFFLSFLTYTIHTYSPVFSPQSRRHRLFSSLWFCPFFNILHVHTYVLYIYHIKGKYCHFKGGVGPHHSLSTGLGRTLPNCFILCHFLKLYTYVHMYTVINSLIVNFSSIAK